jgi:SH3-like domain-containing protein
MDPQRSLRKSFAIDRSCWHYLCWHHREICSVKCCRPIFAHCFALLLLAGVALLPACSRGKGGPKEMAYVSAPQAFLRDQVAAVYNKTGSVKNGEAVQVLARDRRFARVRTSTGAEGWLEQRYLVTKETFDAFEKLAGQMRDQPVQATGVAHNQTNIHLEPQRDADHLYQVDQGAKLSVMKRASGEKPLPAGQAQAAKKGQAEPAAAAMEDWWLIRDESGHVGWVLARMVDIDIPIEIAQYSEGQRTVAAFVLDQVSDAEKKVPQYLVLFSENKDGMPFDFNQIRVFTWNVKRHRYETAYREHGLNGVLPVTVSHETFDKEGDLPVFVVRVKDDAGNVNERKYKLNTPIVRRVLAPGEQKEAASASAGRHRLSVRKKRR